MEETDSARPQNIAIEEKPQPFGGFLIIVAIGLGVSLIQNFTLSLASLRAVFDSSIWSAVTEVNSPAYHPYWKPVLLYELASGAALLILNVVMLWFFFRKKRVFPKLMVILIPFFFALMLVSYYLSGFIPVVAESADYAKLRSDLIVRFIALHVWIPYFLLSTRVEKTFVR